jgi:hypothetical protein
MSCSPGSRPPDDLASLVPVVFGTGIQFFGDYAASAPADTDRHAGPAAAGGTPARPAGREDAGGHSARGSRPGAEPVPA